MSSPNNRKRLRDDVDHISNLPDAILCHILSSFSTKSVVKTCILSKRWRYIWTMVPVLDFSEMHTDYKYLSLEQKFYFKSFVDKILLHNNISYIQRFCLDLYDVDAFYVSSWLLAVARRAIHEVNISLRWTSDFRFFLPPWILWGQKLVILKLKGHFFMNALLCSHFPNLETIHLEEVHFSDNEFLKRLSSSCPVLKELHIVSCSGISTTIYIISLTLKSLKITDLEAKLIGACFVIKTPNLKYICLHGPLSLFDIRDTSSLVEADLYSEYDNDDHREQKLLRKVSGVEILRLGSDTFLDILKFPVFPNLTHFENDMAGEVMCRLLKSAPMLKSLFLDDFDVEYPFDSKLPPEQLPCLEKIDIKDFQGDKKEICAVEYFLKAAPALKEVNIKLSYFGRVKKLATYRKLLRLPRSSPICQVDLRKAGDPFAKLK